MGSDIFDALRTSSPQELRESATRFKPKALKEQMNEQFDMEKGVEKILLERQVAKDRGVLGAVNVAVWHRSVVHEPKKDLEKKLPDRVAKKYLTKRGVSDRSAFHAMNSDSRAEAYKGGRGGDEEHATDLHMSKSTRAIERIFQA